MPYSIYGYVEMPEDLMVKRLCEEKGLPLPIYSMHDYLFTVDEHLSVRLLKVKGTWFLITPRLAINIKDYSYWQCIHRVLRLSFAWPGKNISVAWDDSEQMLIQSTLSDSLEYSALEQTFDEHCYFVDTVHNQSENSSMPSLLMEHHAFITP